MPIVEVVPISRPSRTAIGLPGLSDQVHEAFYAIAIDPPERQAIKTRVNAQALREITAETGGRTEVVQNSAELQDATAAIAEELRSQYVVGYNSPRAADGQYHSIRVRVIGADYRVRSRTGYVATPKLPPKSNY